MTLATLASMAGVPGWAADIDIYGPPGKGGEPNVVFLLDNTSNWSSNNQGWNSGASWLLCENLAEPALAACKNLIETIYYAGIGPSVKRPWDNGYNKNDTLPLTQGQIQLRSLKLVLNALVCSGNPDALNVNVGLSMIGTSGSTLNNGHATGFIQFAVQPLTVTPTNSCAALIGTLDTIDKQITAPTYKAPSNANYGAPLYEIFKYFGGHSNPTLASNVEPNGGSPVGATGYGPVRFSNRNTLDDLNAFTDGGTTYKSPITAANSCGNNYVVLVGNTYPNAEANNGGPTIFNGIGYTPTPLDAVSSDTRSFADEWSNFLANTDVSAQPGIQRVLTYAINTYKDKPDPSQGKLLKSMATNGGIGASGYLEVGGDLAGLVAAFKKVLISISNTESVFTATTLPVSTTTQGTYLNQIFVGMFRPDAKGSPRWTGNLKQYQLGKVGGTPGKGDGTLELVDKNGNVAVDSNKGLFVPLAESFWTEPSVFFSQLKSGTPLSASDLPDGAIVEKGGAAQMLRKAYQNGAYAGSPPTARNVKTEVGGTLVDFRTAGTVAAADVRWILGENIGLPTPTEAEMFNGYYDNSGTPTALGATGPRHSIHGDVLHSRPVALNYGTDPDGGVVVYYGANDGFFRAVDGNKTGPTAGHELWSFIAPGADQAALLTRLRTGDKKIHLPEINSAGVLTAVAADTAPKTYGMDGPIGVYALYAGDGGSVTEAMIYPTMRRGGNSVFAFNVKSKNSPSLSWTITPARAGYAKLAQTWSMPKPVVFGSASGPPPVILLMGGGYDPAEDTNASADIGNVVYVIEGRTGNLIVALPTDYSVPSDVTVADVDSDGEPDRAYVADVRGGLYRIDLPKPGDNKLDAAKYKITKIAALGNKVFFAPDVVVTNKFVAVLVGTGDREKPRLVSTSDKFFLIKDIVGDFPRPTVLTTADLTRVAKIDDATMAPTEINTTKDDEGCYLELATNGEKVVNAPFSIVGATYFGTNRPTPANATTCNADLGQAFAYKFPLFCGVPTKPTEFAGGGLPPSPVGGIVTLMVDGKEVKTPFLIGGGGPKIFKVDDPRPPVPPIRTRQNWRIDNRNK